MSDQEARPDEAVQMVTPGMILAQARDNQGLSIAEVAEKLKITESYVKAIEDSAFDVLPQPAFVRGYIRNYACLLGLSGDELAKGFDLLIGNNGLDIPQLQGNEKVKPLRAHSAPSPAYALILLLVVSLGGQSYYLWNNWLDNEPVAEVEIDLEIPKELLEPPVAAKIVDPVMADAVKAGMGYGKKTPDAAAEVKEESSSVLGVVSSEFSPISVESTEILNITANDALRKPAAETCKTLAIDFSEDCWVEIKDATDKVLVFSVQKAGSSINLDVFPPVSIRFGNVPGIGDIRFDGKPVVMPRSRTRVASVLLIDNQR